jgi:hypothetical protein
MQRLSRIHWALWVAIAFLAFDTLLLVADRLYDFNTIPLNEQGQIPYWIVLFHSYANLPLAVCIGVVFLYVLARWVIRRRAETDERQSRINWQRLFAAGLLLLAAIIAGMNGAPYLFINYRHLDNATFNGRVYNLGLREAMDGDNACVLCACDGIGFLCQCQYVRLFSNAEAAQFEQARLEIEPATGALLVLTGDNQLITTGGPP